MKTAHESVDMAEGQDLLTHLPSLYYAITRSARLEVLGEHNVECSIEVPALGWRRCAASTAREAVRMAFVAVLDECTAMAVHQWPMSWHQIAAESNCGAPQSVSVASSGRPERFRSKGRQFTIGVTLPTKLKEAMQATAQAQSTTFADVARQLANFGFEEFDLRSFSEDGEALFAELASELRQWLPSNTEQVMVRVEPNLSVRLRSAAQEVQKSASEFGAMCIAAGLAKQAEFARIQERIDTVKGVKTRELATQLGLGKHSALLASILQGSLRPPKKVLKGLGAMFGTPEGTLSHYFKCSFAMRAVPAFKADGKPVLTQRATSWKDAVKSLDLLPNEASQLMALDA
ncbi:hypothetical protein [Variovorax sp. V118]|uniref:hypothetical protein n=1 Tax=Variovorax sp. V118 TaxID=3065954 RepID=UPI0034E891E6